MARPLKKGLHYFPLDTDFFSNRKVRRLLSKYGCEGISTYVILLCEIYGGCGYYARFSPESCSDIGFILNISEALVKEMVDFCLKIKLFDQTLFEQQQALSSIGIQLRYREIYKRKRLPLDPDIKLIELNEPTPGTETGVPSSSPKKRDAKNKENPTKVIDFESETLDFDFIAPIKGKGKGKGKGNTKEIKLTKKQNHENSFFNDSEANARRAELLRMAEAAAAGERHV